jgi:hypothetical protein
MSGLHSMPESNGSPGDVTRYVMRQSLGPLMMLAIHFVLDHEHRVGPNLDCCLGRPWLFAFLPLNIRNGYSNSEGQSHM